MTEMRVFPRAWTTAALAALCLSVWATPSLAQTSVTIGGKEIQLHASFQQGFIVTDANNFLTMDTTRGSGAMTDAAVNVSSNLTRKLRLGAQMYTRNIGELGNGGLQVDWAFADYRFHDAIGLRAGKVKTPLGLFNDTQDMEFLYTWALLPQAVYPLDLRSITIAHIGADVYGTVELGKAGSIAYSAYGGKIQDDDQGGYRYGVEDYGLLFRSAVREAGGGFDARWATPVNGLMTGYSFMQTKTTADLFLTAYGMNLTAAASPSRRQALYADYQGPKLRLSGEWRREFMHSEMTPAVLAGGDTRSQSHFVSASYRLSEKFEVGTYYSRYVYDTALDAHLANNHIHDTALSGRVDLNRYWHVKIEGHFMDGNGSPTLARGFYLRSNTGGFSDDTRMLVIRTGVNF
jgi:hypothetical protein